MDRRHRNLLESRVEESFQVERINGRYEPARINRNRLPAFRPPRDTQGAFIRLTPFGIFAGDAEHDLPCGFWSIQGYSRIPYRDAIWLGEWFFNHFVVIWEDEDQTIIDIDEF